MTRLLILTLFLAISGCRPTDTSTRIDSSAYFLDGGDTSHVYISKQVGDKFVVVIDEMVVDHRIEGEYLFVLQKVANSYDCKDSDGKLVIVTIRTNNDAYWIVDLKRGREFGPFEKQTFAAQAKSTGLSVPALKGPSNYHTNEADFESIRLNCVPLGR